MGIEETAGAAANKAIDALGANPILLGVLLMMAVAMGANIYQQHDTATQNKEMLTQILQFRHDELMAVLDKLAPNERRTLGSGPGAMNLEPR